MQIAARTTLANQPAPSILSERAQSDCVLIFDEKCIYRAHLSQGQEQRMSEEAARSLHADAR
jgi:hypothetical protein